MNHRLGLIKGAVRQGLFFARIHPIGTARWARAGANCFITCSGKQDRAGARALAILSTMLFAERVGMRYVHTPFHRLGLHASVPFQPLPRDNPDFADKWEAFFNLGHGEMTLADVAPLGLEHATLGKLADFPFGTPNRFYTALHCHDYASVFPDQYLAIVDRFRQKYDAPSKDHLLTFDHSTLNVAVHVRRGDVGPNAHAGRYTPNDRIAARIQSVRAANAGSRRPVAVHLYSEGLLEDFGPLQTMDITFHLNEDPLSSFHALVRADVLLMSKSTFSYVAALLSRGVAVYESFAETPFNLRPLRHWLTAHSRQGVHHTQLRRALQRSGAAGTR